MRIERIVVRKSQRRLLALCSGGARFETAVALGRGGPGPKRHAGDARTPEGTYLVLAPAHTSRFHRFVPLDYPSPDDADRALAGGLVSPAEHARIATARELGVPPPFDTALGGEFGLHGEGPHWRGASADIDWTLGCLAVDDEAIDFLAERLPVGTPVEIRP